MAIQGIFIIILIFIVFNINTDTYEPANIPISNFEHDLEGLPENSLDVIESMLYDTIASNGGTLENISDSDAKVRENSMIDLYFEDINMHYVNFIIDIPSIEQSYQIFNEWSDDRTNPNYLTNMATMIMCPLKEQLIYTDFNCKDEFDHKGQRILVSKFIDHFDNDYFAPYFKEGDFSTIYINPISFNLSNSTKQRYIGETKDAVTSLGIPPDIFKYHVLEQSDLDYNIPLENR
ncbi:MAG: hypothetical protein Q4F56_00045 [Candidatus Saccharibacteria bacterium]|nr:hypothetical protein [Candidatus Saccharibacteria bacterium]